MDDLIAALTIFRKYGNPTFPTNCTHDTLGVMIFASEVSQEDLVALAGLDFHPDEFGTFYSHRFGSA